MESAEVSNEGLQALVGMSTPPNTTAEWDRPPAGG